MTETKKRAKLLAAFVAAAVFALALSVSAFAAGGNITVNNAKAGETYSAYKMLDLSVDNETNPSAYRYTVNSNWTDFFSEANKAAWQDVFTIDDNGYVTSTVESETAWFPASALSKFAEAAAAYAKTKPVAAAATNTPASGNTATLATTENGYYLITSTLGSRAMIETTPSNPDATVNEKNSEDTVEKEVQEDSNGAWGKSNDAQVGDTVNFRTKVKIVPRSINVKVHDVMNAGLTLAPESIAVVMGTAEAPGETAVEGATIRTGESADEGDTFTVVIPDSVAAETTEDAYVWVLYSATLNEKAIANNAPAHQVNDTHVSFGDNATSEHDTTTTITYKFDVHKYAQGKQYLAGAVFQLEKGGTVVPLVKLNDNNYRVATANDETTTDTFVTVATGNITILGVDNDNDYMLRETEAPEGYNLLANPMPVNVGIANEFVAEIENQSGTELPSTGGIGTTIFYIVGSLLVIGAVVYLVTKRRASKASADADDIM